jgi:large subunit ribosomal protein L21
MYAVIETGGKQYRVEVGTELAVELLDAEPGEEITLDRVLLVADGDEAAVGRPVVADATVSATVLRRDRADKLIVFKYKPKTRSRVKKGHRQEQTILRITDVRLGAKSAAAEVAAVESAREVAAHADEAAAAEQAARDAALAAILEGKAEAAREDAAPAEAPRKTTRGRAKAAPAPGAEDEAEPVAAEPVVESVAAEAEPEATEPAEVEAADTAEPAEAEAQTEAQAESEPG